MSSSLQTINNTAVSKTVDNMICHLLIVAALQHLVQSVTMEDVQKVLAANAITPLADAPVLLESLKISMLVDIDLLTPVTRTDVEFDAVMASVDETRREHVRQEMDKALNNPSLTIPYIHFKLMNPAYEIYVARKAIEAGQATELANGLDVFGFIPDAFESVSEELERVIVSSTATAGGERDAARNYFKARILLQIEEMGILNRIRYMLDKNARPELRIVNFCYVNFRARTIHGIIVDRVSIANGVDASNWQVNFEGQFPNAARAGELENMEVALRASIHHVVLGLLDAKHKADVNIHDRLDSHTTADLAFATAKRVSFKVDDNDHRGSQAHAIREGLTKLVTEMEVLFDNYKWDRYDTFIALNSDELPLRSLIYHFYLLCPKLPGIDLRAMTPADVDEDINLRAYANQFLAVQSTLYTNHRSAQYILQLMQILPLSDFAWEGGTAPTDGEVQSMLGKIVNDLEQPGKEDEARSNVNILMQKVTDAKKSRFIDIFKKKLFEHLKRLNLSDSTARFVDAANVGVVLEPDITKLHGLAAGFTASSEFFLLNEERHVLTNTCTGTAEAEIAAASRATERTAVIKAIAEKVLYVHTIQGLMDYIPFLHSRLGLSYNYLEQDLSDLLAAKLLTSCDTVSKNIQTFIGTFGGTHFETLAPDVRISCLTYALKGEVINKTREVVLENIQRFKTVVNPAIVNDVVTFEPITPETHRKYTRRRTSTKKSSSSSGSKSSSTSTAKNSTKTEDPKKKSDSWGARSFEAANSLFVLSALFTFAFV